uniref:Uncharacterized protein n=1 Tax=Solanum tuberosum TaxID=4113 RepID=M1DGI0_SOLTU
MDSRCISHILSIPSLQSSLVGHHLTQHSDSISKLNIYDLSLGQPQTTLRGGIMSNTSPIGEGSENIMEVLANISKQVAEMNGRMGGMEERLVRVENENRRKAIQPEYDEIRRASVHSTALALGQAHNLCYPPQS